MHTRRWSLYLVALALLLVGIAPANTAPKPKPKPQDVAGTYDGTVTVPNVATVSAVLVVEAAKGRRVNATLFVGEDGTPVALTGTVAANGNVNLNGRWFGTEKPPKVVVNLKFAVGPPDTLNGAAKITKTQGKATVEFTRSDPA